MKQLFLLLIIPSFLYAQDFTDEVHLFSPEEHTEEAIFDEIGRLVQDKRIVLLGEAGHGDGRTFKYKTKLIKHLVDNYGFTTVGLEGGDFLGFQYLNGTLPQDTLTKTSFTEAWFALWSHSEQVQDLLDFFEEPHVEPFGFESQITNFTLKFIPYLKSQVKDSSFDWNYMDSIAKRACYIDTSTNMQDIISLQNQLMDVQQKLTDSDEAEILSLSIANFNSFLEQWQLGFYDYEAQNKGINIRDKRMADNIIWYLDKYPEKKMIVWAANFHIAKDISEVQYGKKDPTLYERYHLMGEHLYEQYGDALFSIAFTSSEGVQGNTFSKKADELVIHDGTFEMALHKKNKAIGFVNFSKLKEKNKTFYSHMLNLKLGRWYNVFDGVFYIRRQEKSRRKKATES